MRVSTEISINADKAAVWKAITDIENSARMISGINKIEVIDKPAATFAGLKWKETRTLFGKEATETMWVTEAKENEFYATRAESHGSVYITKRSLEHSGERTRLTTTFEGLPQTLAARLLSFLMAPLIKGSIMKSLAQDHQEIKNYIETQARR